MGDSMTFLPFKTIAPYGAAAVIPMPGSPTLDAFGRQRVSNPTTVFDSQFHFDKQPLLWDESSAGTGSAAYNSATNSVVLDTGGTASGADIIRQTFQRHYYQPGKSQLILCTGLFGAPKTNVRKRVGYFDALDGLFLEIDSTTANFVTRTSTSGAAVDTKIAQASWNIDKMNGSGPSGITIDFNSTQIFAIDLEWLGVGAVRFGFVIGGVFRPCHLVQNANAGLTVPYMATATLPIRYSLTNTGVADSATTMRQICATVISEGGQNPLGIARVALSLYPRNFANSVTYNNLVSVRLKSTALRSKFAVASFSFTGDGAEIYEIALFRGGTLSATSWTSLGADSIVEYTNVVATYTPGTQLRSFSIRGVTSSLQIPIDELLPLGVSIAGTPVELHLAARKLAGGGADTYAVLNIKELQ
jgi:hypothetical protein